MSILNEGKAGIQSKARKGRQVNPNCPEEHSQHRANLAKKIELPPRKWKEVTAGLKIKLSGKSKESAFSDSQALTSLNESGESPFPEING